LKWLEKKKEELKDLNKKMSVGIVENLVIGKQKNKIINNYKKKNLREKYIYFIKYVL
jgi:hypothetical protein